MTHPILQLAYYLAIAIVGGLILLFGVLRPSTYAAKTTSTTSKPEESMSVSILVLGDIGRSPRMQYHAISLIRKSARVQLIGFTGMSYKTACSLAEFPDSEIYPELKSSELVTIIALKPPHRALQTNNKIVFLAVAPLKVLWQAFDLYHALSYRTKATQWLLVQNPPAIPVLAIACFTCFMRHTELVIDWHNFGWSVLALRLGPTHPLVKISARYEWTFGPKPWRISCGRRRT